MEERETPTRGTIEALFVACLVVGSYIVALGLPVTQGFAWLKTGVVPDRDLFWLLADTKCQATGWTAMGWTGMDACREPYWHISDWVGLNQLVNWAADIHLSIVSAVFGLAVWCAAEN